MHFVFICERKLFLNRDLNKRDHLLVVMPGAVALGAMGPCLFNPTIQ